MIRRETVEETAEELINNFEGVVVNHEIDLKNGVLSAYVYDSGLDFGVWVDCSIEPESKDFTGEWNQYIFCTTDFEDCVSQKFQENVDMFDYCTSEATSFFIKLGVVVDCNNDGYKLNKDYKR